jgi:hypothetical protein
MRWPCHKERDILRSCWKPHAMPPPQAGEAKEFVVSSETFVKSLRVPSMIMP